MSDVYEVAVGLSNGAGDWDILMNWPFWTIGGERCRMVE